MLVVVALLPYYVTIMAQPSSSKSFGRAKFELVIEEDEEYQQYKTLISSTLAVSADGTTIAIGSETFGNVESGFVNVYNGYSFNSRRQWGIPESNDIIALSLALSSDGAIVATASASGLYDAITNDYTYSGQVRVFQKNSNEIYAEISSDFKSNGACANAYRYALAMSDDGQIISIRAYDDTDCDVVRFYKRNTSNQMYEQVGSDITLHEEDSNYKLGGPLVMSADGTTFAILLFFKPAAICCGITSEQVRLYEKNASSQMYDQQVRLDINGSSDQIDDSRADSTKLALSADGRTLVFGALTPDGYTDIFVFQKSPVDQVYKQIGPSIFQDERATKFTETPIAVSADGSRIASALRLNNRNENCRLFCDSVYDYQVRVYENTDGSAFEMVASVVIPTEFVSTTYTNIKLDMTADGSTIAVSVQSNGPVSVFITKPCLLGFGIFDNLFCPFSFRDSVRRLLRSILNN